MEYVSIVPQYNEFGYDTGLWMASINEQTCPNLVLGWLKGHHRVLVAHQVEDFYEDDEAEWDEHMVELGRLDCSDTYGDEWEEKFVRWLDETENAWWL